LAGHEFLSFGELEAHVSWWLRAVSDQRWLQDFGETPLQRFEREAQQLQPVAGRVSFAPAEECRRRVSSDCMVTFENNHYSVPWRWVGAQVSVQVREHKVRIYQGAKLLAEHGRLSGRGQRAVHSSHVQGLVGSGERRQSAEAARLLRPLAEYERVSGGSF